MEGHMLEMLPPPITWSGDRTAKYCHSVVSVLRQLNVLSVGIPEVLQEIRDSERHVDFVGKMDNVEFAHLLKTHHHALVPVIYKICVKMPKGQFAEWVARTYENGIRHIVLVGGEQDIVYPGYSVLDAAHYIKQHYPDVKLGGITIFTRPGEDRRILSKVKVGIDFFFSQIIFEAANMKQVLLNLVKICMAEQLVMPRIYLSLALASKSRDIEFMKWLGVEFPTAIYSYLTEEREESIEARSSQVVEMMLDEIFHFIKKEKIDVGLNIEHVMYTNLHLSQKLFSNIKRRIAQE